jgi:hypothetical protein
VVVPKLLFEVGNCQSGSSTLTARERTAADPSVD